MSERSEHQFIQSSGTQYFFEEIKRQSIRGSISLVGGTVVLLGGMISLLLIAIEIVFALGGGFSTANWIAAIALITASLILIRPIRYWRHEGWGRYAQARYLDRMISGAADRFITAWNLKHKPPETKLGFSPDLILATQEWCAESIKNPTIPFPNRLRFIHGLSLGGIVLALALFGVLPGAGERRTHLYEAWNWFIQEPLRIDDTEREDSGNITIARGQGVTLWVAMKSTDDDAAEVSVDVGSGSIWRNYLAKSGPENRWIVSIPALGQSCQYTFTGDDWSTSMRHIEVVDPPRLERLIWMVHPPAYTLQSDRTIEHEIWDLAVPEGSQLTARVESNQQLGSARIQLNEREILFTSHSDNSKAMMGRFAADEGGAFSIHLTNQLGLLTQSATGQLSIIRDATPRVLIMSPEPVVKVEGNATVSIVAMARDDYGLGSVTLVTERNNEESNRTMQAVWTASSTPSSATQIEVKFHLNLQPFDLYPGDEMRYWLEAADTDALHGPKIGRTDPQMIRYPSLAEVYQDLFGQEEEQVFDFNQLLDEQRALTEQAKNTAQDLRDRTEQKGESLNPDEAWDQRQDIQDIKKRQEELQEEYKTIQQALEEMTAAQPSDVQKETGLTTNMLEKVEKIQQLMDQMITEEGKQLINQINETVNKLAEQIDPEHVDDLAYSLQEYEKDLDRTLEQLERTFQERQLQGLNQVAKDLQRRQDALQRETQRLTQEIADASIADASENQTASPTDRESTPSTPTTEQQNLANRMAERQEQLQQDAEALVQAIEQTADLMEKMNPSGADQLRQAGKQAKEGRLSQNMNNAAQNLAQMNLQQAARDQEQARQSLQQLASQLEESMASLGGMQIQIDTMALEEVFQRILFLSNWVENLVVSPLADRRSLRSLEEAGFCQREAKRLAALWDEMARGNPFLNAEVAKDLDAAARSLSRSQQEGEGKAWIGFGHAERAMEQINRALWNLHMNLRSLAQQMGQGSAEELMQQLQQLAQQQQQLNDRTDQMGQQQQGEQNPQEGRTGNQSLRETLQRMAQQQAGIREEIRRLMEQFQHIQGMQARLENIASEMESIEKQLAQGELNNEVKKQQKEVLMRMLEAQVSQEQDEVGRRRRAETSQEDQVQPAGDEIRFVEDDSKAEMEIEESDPTMPIPPAYRNWVKSYLRELRRNDG